MSKFGYIEIQCFAQNLNCFAVNIKCRCMNAKMHECVNGKEV